MRKGKALLNAAVGIAIALTFLGGCGTAHTETPEDAQATPPVQTSEYPPLDYPDESEAIYIPVDTEADHEDPWSGWSDDQSRLRIKPLDVELDSYTQWDIYKVCDYEDEAFCLLMAIGFHETGLDPKAVGDAGGSVGIFQINVKWHTDRMERLGVTDLTDPVQCAQVAQDYIRELSDRYGFEPYTEKLLMSYNMGPGGASKAISEGTVSTGYSREVMAIYQDFLAQLGGGAE